MLKILIACLLVTALTGFVSASEDLKVYYMNTTSGEATLLESSGHFMMIDAGNVDDVSKVSTYLKDTGVTRLDYAVATSLNETDIGGMPALMNDFPVSIYIDPSTKFSSVSHDKIKKKIESDEIGYQEAASGATLPFGASTIQVLDTTTSADDASANALSLLVSAGNNTFLFTGMKDPASTHATVWAVPDLGSNGSLDVLSAILPEAIVISSGTGGPDKKSLETLKKMKTEYLLTNTDGDVVISSDGTDYTIKTSNGKVLQKPTPTITPAPKQTTNPDKNLTSSDSVR